MNTGEQQVSTKSEEEKRYKIKAGVFLTSIGAISALVGFSKTLTSAKKDEQKFLQQAGANKAYLLDAGSALALRALGWGTLYAFLGTGAFCFGVWKLSGAKDMQEFRIKMGSMLPRMTPDGPPASRTEFDGLTDLLKYVSTWGKE